MISDGDIKGAFSIPATPRVSARCAALETTTRLRLRASMRISVGLEDVEDVKEDLAQALLA